MSTQQKFENILKSMDLKFFASGKHKITAEKLFESKDAVFLDVRSKAEAESIALPLRSTVKDSLMGESLTRLHFSGGFGIPFQIEV